MEKEITKLLSFKWQKLDNEFASITNGESPGVYLLAYTNKKLLGKNIALKDIYYVGMSNSKKGVKNRLKQFINGIEKGYGHSAGNRFYSENGQNKPYSKTKDKKKFYYVSLSFLCNVSKDFRTPNDLKIMGNIAKLEYYILAHIKDKTSCEPLLNKK